MSKKVNGRWSKVEGRNRRLLASLNCYERANFEDDSAISLGVSGSKSLQFTFYTNKPHLIISLLISHYQSDGIISTIQYSETLLHIIVIFVVIILIRTVTEIVN